MRVTALLGILPILGTDPVGCIPTRGRDRLACPLPTYQWFVLSRQQCTTRWPTARGPYSYIPVVFCVSFIATISRVIYCLAIHVTAEF